MADDDYVWTDVPDGFVDYFEVDDVVVVRQSEDALLVEIPTPIGKGRYWLPKAAVHGINGTTMGVYDWFRASWEEKTK